MTTWYHGGPSGRTNFQNQIMDRPRSEAAGNDIGPGIYLTADPAEAKRYAYPNGSVYQIAFGGTTFSESQPSDRATVQRFLNALPKQAKELAASNWDENVQKGLRAVLNSAMQDTTLIGALLEIKNQAIPDNPNEFARIMNLLGFDAMLRSNGRHLVVYDPATLTIIKEDSTMQTVATFRRKSASTLRLRFGKGDSFSGPVFKSMTDLYAFLKARGMLNDSYEIYEVDDAGNVKLLHESQNSETQHGLTYDPDLIDEFNVTEFMDKGPGLKLEKGIGGVEYVKSVDRPTTNLRRIYELEFKLHDLKQKVKRLKQQGREIGFQTEMALSTMSDELQKRVSEESLYLLRIMYLWLNFDVDSRDVNGAGVRKAYERLAADPDNVGTFNAALNAAHNNGKMAEYLYGGEAVQLLRQFSELDTTDWSNQMQVRLGRRKPIHAAGYMYLTADLDKVYLAERNDGKGWCNLGGSLEMGEDPRTAADREVLEEGGSMPTVLADLGEYDYEGYRTHFVAVDPENWKPTLDKSEHKRGKWFKVADLPRPIHPGVVAALTHLREYEP